VGAAGGTARCAHRHDAARMVAARSRLRWQYVRSLMLLSPTLLRSLATLFRSASRPIAASTTVHAGFMDNPE
jgi:hypothetical protein